MNENIEGAIMIETETPTPTLEVTIVDVVVTRRRVVVPSVCPHCEESLIGHEGEGIAVESIDQVSQHGRVEMLNRELGELFMEMDETTGNYHEGYLDIKCRGCDESVIEQPGEIRTA